METINYKGYTIKIEQDEHSRDPRTEFDNLGKMICFHRNYRLGDKHEYSLDDFDGFDDMEKQLVKDYDAAIILPLYLYDHSGITMKTSPFGCRWDSGQVGFILMTKQDAIDNWGKKRMTPKVREKALNYLEAEVKTYDQYLTGDVYGYQIESPEGEDLDSCWGFFGHDHEKSGLLEYAQNAIDYQLDNVETV